MLSQIKTDIHNCQRCKLAGTRKNIVFGEGPEDADWMFIGEAPGANEDEQGFPFVGRSGDLLEQKLNDLSWDRGEVYISNIVKCRPPNNRNPEKDEIESCKPFLLRQISSIKPIVITTLGKYATQLLLEVNAPMYKLRGKIWPFEGLIVIPTYHPSYILRGNKEAEKSMEDDLMEAFVRLAYLQV